MAHYRKGAAASPSAGAGGLDLHMFENPQAEDGEELSGMSPLGLAGPWSGSGPPWHGQDHMATPDLTSVHAANATTAAYYSDVAAKHAASLAQWVQYLQLTVAGLQSKVTDLENWKRNALEDVRQLRDEHRLLRRRVLGEDRVEDAPLPARTRSTPALSALSLSDEPVRIGPPGLLSLGEPAKIVRASADPIQVDSSPSHDGSSLPPPTPFSAVPSEASLSDLDAGHLEGVTVGPGEVNGVECVRAEWRIGHLSTRLRGCMGRPLVSSPFTAAGLEDLRLMVVPDGKDTAKGPRSRRQKELYAKKVTEGPLEGSLKLKAPCACPEAAQEIEYYLKVGGKRVGPFRHNSAESTVSGCDDFGVDWLKQLEVDQSLTVCVEIVAATNKGAAA